MVRYISVFGLAAMSLAACSTASIEKPIANAPLRSSINAGGLLEQASLSTPIIATMGPTGLAPCKRGVFPAENCWRRGDEHVIYPEMPPAGIAVNKPTKR